MSNIEYINLLPDSIYKTDPGSTNYKLWKLFADQMDELDAVFTDLSLLADYSSRSGAALDLVGKILRESRQGRADSDYIKYLYIAIKKYLSNGSIPDLTEICNLLLGDEFIYIRDMNHEANDDNGEESFLDGSWYLTGDKYMSLDSSNPDLTWLDGSWLLDGSNYLSGDVYQYALFEVVVASSTSDTVYSILAEMIRTCRMPGIAARIRKSEE